MLYYEAYYVGHPIMNYYLYYTPYNVYYAVFWDYNEYLEYYIPVMYEYYVVACPVFKTVVSGRVQAPVEYYHFYIAYADAEYYTFDTEYYYAPVYVYSYDSTYDYNPKTVRKNSDHAYYYSYNYQYTLPALWNFNWYGGEMSYEMYYAYYTYTAPTRYSEV